MTNIQSDDFRRERNVVIHTAAPKRRSALPALLLSVMAPIPLAPIAGALMAATGARRNTSMAKAALAFGLAFTVVQAFVGFRGFQYVETATNGVNHALASGLSGQTRDFAFAFRNGAPNVVEAATFLEQLGDRYGTFQEATVEDSLVSTEFTKPRTYRLVFEKGTVRARVTMALDTSIGLDLLATSIDSIVVEDDELTDLTFPAATRMLTQHP